MYRNRVSSFNNAQLLTHGNPIGLSALATRFNSVDANSAETICTGDDEPLVAQILHNIGERSAHLNFITPEPSPDHSGLLALLDFLCIRAGEMGAANLLAEVRDSDQILETFRHSCFSIYGWETTWRLPSNNGAAPANRESTWRRVSSVDESVIRTLYHTLVPPLVQTAEPYYSSDSNRLIYREKGETIAFVEVLTGSKGIYLKPVIHPSLENPAEMLAELMGFFQSPGKPVYLQMRSYQAWLTSILESMNAETTVHFALMARRLAIAQFAVAESRHIKLENRQTETSATIVQNISRTGR